jgi:hypothetical protein
MADDRMAVLESVRKAIADGDVDFLREGVRVLAQAVMEAEVTELTGVPHGERDPERRLTRRGGCRSGGPRTRRQRPAAQLDADDRLPLGRLRSLGAAPQARQLALATPVPLPQPHLCARPCGCRSAWASGAWLVANPEGDTPAWRADASGRHA